MSSKTDWVVVDTVAGEIDAQIDKSILDEAGIPVVLQAKSGRVYAFSVGSMAEVRVMVPSEYADEAKALLAPGEEQPPQPDE